MSITCFVAIYFFILDNVLFLYIYRELFYKLIGCVLNIIRFSYIEPYLNFFSSSATDAE
jgi:hypothetical protein